MGEEDAQTLASPSRGRRGDCAVVDARTHAFSDLGSLGQLGESDCTLLNRRRRSADRTTLPHSTMSLSAAWRGERRLPSGRAYPESLHAIVFRAQCTVYSMWWLTSTSSLMPQAFCLSCRAY